VVVCLERGADLHMPSWCHCHSLSLASVKSRLVLPFWCRPTLVVLEKGPLNGCVCAVLPIYCNLLLCSEVERRIFKAQAADESEARESKPATWGSSEVSCRCCWKSEFHRNFICHLYAVYLSWNNKTSNRNRILERWKFRFQFWLVRRWTILSTVLRRFAMNLELSHWITARMPLLTSTSTYGLLRRRWSSHQQCFVHCLHTISLCTIHKCL